MVNLTGGGAGVRVAMMQLLQDQRKMEQATTRSTLLDDDGCCCDCLAKKVKLCGSSQKVLDALASPLGEQGALALSLKSDVVQFTYRSSGKYHSTRLNFNFKSTMPTFAYSLIVTSISPMAVVQLPLQPVVSPVVFSDEPR